MEAPYPPTMAIRNSKKEETVPEREDRESMTPAVMWAPPRSAPPMKRVFLAPNRLKSLAGRMARKRLALTAKENQLSMEEDLPYLASKRMAEFCRMKTFPAVMAAVMASGMYRSFINFIFSNISNY